MRVTNVLSAALVLVILHGYATAKEHSSPREKVEEQKFVGTWKGYQGRYGQRNVEATYKFWIEQNQLLGKFQYLNLRRHDFAKGTLSELTVRGNTIMFLVTTKRGRSRYELELKDSLLEGTGHQIDRGRDFDVSLKKVE